MFFRMVNKSGQIFLPFCHNTRVWKTDRQTDGQTDRILIGRPRLYCMQRGKKSLHNTHTYIHRFIQLGQWSTWISPFWLAEATV